MAYTELVRIGEVEFLARIAEAGGAQPVGAQPAYSFDGVRQTIEAVAGQVAEVWQKVKPDEASVEFGLSIAARSGKLLGLLVDGSGEAALKITLTWRNPTQSVEGGESAQSSRAGLTAGLPIPTGQAGPAEPPSGTGTPGQAVAAESGASA